MMPKMEYEQRATFSGREMKLVSHRKFGSKICYPTEFSLRIGNNRIRFGKVHIEDPKKRKWDNILKEKERGGKKEKVEQNSNSLSYFQSYNDSSASPPSRYEVYTSLGIPRCRYAQIFPNL